jgi:secreted trypsin-like serine protease
MMLWLAFLMPSFAIVGGDRTDEWDNVAWVDLEGGSCSGTLIAPTFVLTAAHCIDGLAIVGGKSVAFGETSTTTGPEYDIADVHQPPGWTGSAYDGFDIGLIELVDPVDDIPLMPIYVADDLKWEPESLLLVGFGVTSEDANNAGKKREVEVAIDNVDRHNFFTLDPGYNMCWGDSGGPALVETPNGWLQVGIISYVWGDEPACSNGGGASTRIETHLDWISQWTDIVVEPWDPPADTPSVDDNEDEDETEDARACSHVGHSGWLPLLFAMALGRRQRQG